ncbi:MAG: hypoxanthine phosphoribosyltransferase [Acidobacteriota bacterium]
MSEAQATLAAPRLGRVVLSETAIQERVAAMAAEVSRDYGPRRPLILPVLNGAVPFARDLCRHLRIAHDFDLLGIARYPGRTSRERARVTLRPATPLQGRDVLLVEDIVDTGLTLYYLLGVLAAQAPASLRVISLLERPELRLADLRLDYVGFQVSEAYLVGYGLDFDDRFRGLPYIAELEW